MAETSGRARGKHETAAQEKDPERVPSEHERYLEALAQRAEGEDAPYLDGVEGEARDYKVEGNDTSNYVGVSPEYMTYSDEKNMPRRAEEGPEQAAEERILNPDNFPLGKRPERESNQIKGSGSLDPHVMPSTSGEALEHGEPDADPEAAALGEDGVESKQSRGDQEAPDLGGGNENPLPSS